MSDENRRRAPHRHFTPDEDSRLREFAPMYDENWDLIALAMRGPTARQCRERWVHYISPSVSTSPWTAEDDAVIEEKVQKYGRHWKFLEKYLTGRKDNQIKNRYKVILRRKNKQRKLALKEVEVGWPEIESDLGFGNYEFGQCEYE
jgi:hypothetical protein